MASVPTTRLRAIKPGTGDFTNTWGLELNAGAVDILDEAIAGVGMVVIGFRPR